MDAQLLVSQSFVRTELAVSRRVSLGPAARGNRGSTGHHFVCLLVVGMFAWGDGGSAFGRRLC